MIPIACAIPSGLESAAVGDDMSHAVVSMAALQTRGVTFGQALEETPAPARDP
jgi:hypothetical protein